MIKLICFLKRNKALSIEQFHTHWRDVHGPLFANSPEMHKHIARYEQNPRLAADYRRDAKLADFADQGHDGVTVIWYHSMEAFQAMTTDPFYLKHVVILQPHNDLFPLPPNPPPLHKISPPTQPSMA